MAADDAVFGFTEVKLGILPAVISPFVLPKIGVSAARELFLTGGGSTRAARQEIGLVHAVVPAAELDADGRRATCASCCRLRPTAVAAAKRLIPQVCGQTPARRGRRSPPNAIAEQRVSPEGQEGLRAFLEKRKPEWA